MNPIFYRKYTILLIFIKNENIQTLMNDQLKNT